jgi:hypothetical protein
LVIGEETEIQNQSLQPTPIRALGHYGYLVHLEPLNGQYRCHVDLNLIGPETSRGITAREVEPDYFAKGSPETLIRCSEDVARLAFGFWIIRSRKCVKLAFLAAKEIHYDRARLLGAF